MSYKLIAIDMDGTLLNDDNLIGENTKNALQKATLDGKYTVFATGRMMKSAMNYANRLNLNKPIISCNGAIITNKDKEIIFGGNIDHDVVRQVDKIARKYNTYYHFYSEDKLYTSNYFEKINEFYNKDSKGDEIIEIIEFKDVEEILSENINIYKFLFIEYDNQKLQEIRKELQDLNELNISSSWINNLEVTRNDVSKGNSLIYLTRHLDIDLSSTIAMGDNNNDISMITKAGLGLAMKNGTQEVKEKADIITEFSNNEDAVAEIIEKYLLDN